MLIGGRATLESYGVDPDGPRTTWAQAVPAAHRALLARLVLWHRAGSYLFVHAGLRPGVPFAAQTRQDMLSIRHAFLYARSDFGAIVVHGHTIRPEPELCANRIGLDTGAARGGPLTCAVLEADRIGFLHT